MDPSMFTRLSMPDAMQIGQSMQQYPGAMGVPFTTQPTDESVPWTLSQNTAPRRVGAAIVGFVGALLIVSLAGRR